MTPEGLVRTVEGFLSGARDAVVLEDGAVAFDLAQAKYSISGERNKCLLHLWSAERNVVRRVVDLEVKNEVLRLEVQRLGQPRPTKLEICRQRDRRTPSAKRAARLAYQKRLQRVLARKFPDFKIAKLSNSMDLERSVGPIYARGLLRQGQSAFAVLGVNAQESQASVDASLTFGILWLDLCRQMHAGKTLVHGLKLFVPRGSSSLIRARIANLNRDAAKWQVYEVDEREDSAKEMDTSDRGNVATRLFHCTNERATREQFAQAIAHVRDLMTEVETAIHSPAEMSFRRYGLEFARARLIQEPGSIRSTPQIVFGVGAAEQTLSLETAASFARLVRSIGEVRHAEGPRDHPLWRLHSDRWLESLTLKKLRALDERFDEEHFYSQVPGFSALDRTMVDVLATTRKGRLAVIELKADEDIHLPLQGLDYWSRVTWHHARGEFQRCGYFAGMELSPEPPLLLLVAPELHLHPATDTLLRYLSSEIDWTLVAIDERWRENLKPVFRNRREDIMGGKRSKSEAARVAISGGEAVSRWLY